MFSPRRVAVFLWHFFQLAGPSVLVLLVLSFLTEWLTWQNSAVSPFQSVSFWLAVVVNLIPAILVSVVVFWLAARFVYRMYHLESVKAGVGFLLRARFGLSSFGPWMQIREGRIAMNEDAALAYVGGPGSLVIYNDSAVVLERGGKLTRVVGVGFPTIDAFEKIYDIVDLRPQTWTYRVSAMTKEGISVSWDAEVHYQISNGGTEPTAEKPFPFSPEAVFRAVTTRWNFVNRTTKMDWEGRIIISSTEGILRTIIARWTLDDLIGITTDGAEVARQAVQKELEEGLRKAAPDVGGRILAVRLDNLKVDDPITEQWIRVWQSGWQKWSTEQLARGEAQRIYWGETTKAAAQMSLIVRIARAFEELTASEVVTPRVIMMRLFSVLDRADFSSSARIFWPNEAFTALDSMKRLLVPPGQVVVSFTGMPKTLVAGGKESEIEVKVTDHGGRDVADGTLVEFTSSRGTISPRNVATYRSQAKATLLPDNLAEDILVTVNVSGSSAQVRIFVVPGDPANMVVTANPTRVAARGDTAEIAARVTDRHDNLVVDGTLVEFGPSTVNLQPPTDTTRNGVARTVFESGPTPGFVTIEARAGQIVRSVRVEVI